MVLVAEAIPKLLLYTYIGILIPVERGRCSGYGL